MDNNLDNTHRGNTHCPDCGASYALVNRVHRCVPRTRADATVVPTVERGTYKYRDPVKRRAQVAEAMRRYRAKRKP